MKKTMLWAVLLTALLACKGNSTPANSGEDGPAPDSVTTDVKDDATARLGDHEPTVALPTIVGMGPIDPLYEDNQVLAVAHLGLFSSVNALKASACHRFLESSYPELANIDKIEVDTGKGDLWLLRPRENGGSLAVNKITYHDDGSGNYDVEEVLYRTEDCRPILVRAKIDEYPYALQVNLVAENGQSVQWVPEFDWETRHLKESDGVVDITALPIENSIIMGAYYTVSTSMNSSAPTSAASRATAAGASTSTAEATSRALPSLSAIRNTASTSNSLRSAAMTSASDWAIRLCSRRPSKMTRELKGKS